MQKPLLVLAILVFCVISIFASIFSRWRNHRNVFGRHYVSVSESEWDHRYRLTAHYDRSRAGRLERCLERHLRADHLFRHARMNGNLILDDRTRLYIKSKPGELLIRFDKDENSEEAFRRIQALGNDIKLQLTD
ncbi:MAG: hypothetical protein JO301_16820 [Chitinophagaceae bacterium]|nr:hypothetical protein [Chitinophagaceae bacterium]